AASPAGNAGEDRAISSLPGKGGPPCAHHRRGANRGPVVAQRKNRLQWKLRARHPRAMLGRERLGGALPERTGSGAGDCARVIASEFGAVAECVGGVGLERRGSLKSIKFCGNLPM